MTAPRPEKTPALSSLATLLGVAVAVALAYLAFSQRLPPPPAPGLDAALALAPCEMEPPGYWRGRIFGSTTIAIDWRGAKLECAGNARPGGRGLRLFLAGRPGTGSDRLLLVIGIGAGLDELAGKEHPASVTLLDEATSDFFHGPPERCFTHIRDVSPLADTEGAFRVEGDLYCTGAIAAVSGERSVTLGDMAYAVRLTPDAG
ncbi:MAG: hypothetical protein L6Q83_07840 [Gammaproteobacteria bacterium]|nr:hypothetical protein [Gammaproteobacteria bacterium]